MSVKKIAKQVGTSPATVSRVLNNPEYRCQEPGLRERICFGMPGKCAGSLRTVM